MRGGGREVKRKKKKIKVFGTEGVRPEQPGEEAGRRLAGRGEAGGGWEKARRRLGGGWEAGLYRNKDVRALSSKLHEN